MRPAHIDRGDYKNDILQTQEVSCDFGLLTDIVELGAAKSNYLPALHTRYTQEQVEAVIVKSYGVLTLICAELDCTPKQVYNVLKHWGIPDALKEAKKGLVGLAESAILECLKSENEKIKLQAAQTTLKSLGKEEWSENPTVQISQHITSESEKAIEIKNIFGTE